MPRRKVSYSKTDLNSMLTFFEKKGRKVSSVEFHPDGGFKLIFDQPLVQSTGPTAPSDWNHLLDAASKEA